MRMMCPCISGIDSALGGGVVIPKPFLVCAADRKILYAGHIQSDRLHL